MELYEDFKPNPNPGPISRKKSNAENIVWFLIGSTAGKLAKHKLTKPLATFLRKKYNDNHLSFGSVPKGFNPKRSNEVAKVYDL